MFFQAALLLGYAYAHLSSRLRPIAQAAVQIALLIAATLVTPAAFEPGSARPPDASGSPAVWLALTLARSIGLPFVALAATSSLLQRWYAARKGHAANPYPIYAASNIGSLGALLAYPLIVEPRFILSAQFSIWRTGLLVLTGLTACSASLLLAPRAPKPEGTDDPENRPSPPAPSPPPRARDWLIWTSLAFIPATLLPGVTAYLSTDIAPAPLLWVVPLGLYLLSFIATFTTRPWVPHPLILKTLGPASLLLLPSLAGGLVQWFWLPVHLAFFTLAALAAHGELFRRRPDPAHLTGFYLAVALGGVLGGVFNGVIAPVAFDRMAEYPIAIVLALTVPVFASTTAAPRRSRDQRSGRSASAARPAGSRTPSGSGTRDRWLSP
jgi:hypothetical protein